MALWWFYADSKKKFCIVLAADNEQVLFELQGR